MKFEARFGTTMFGSMQIDGYTTHKGENHLSFYIDGAYDGASHIVNLSRPEERQKVVALVEYLQGVLKENP